MRCRTGASISGKESENVLALRPRVRSLIGFCEALEIGDFDGVFHVQAWLDRGLAVGRCSASWK